ncbi:MAG TPA: BatD family protein, partial [Kofleriaceae bacterium]|nr:BatD family protein [Kofleriaceae bacterium]
IVPMFDMEDTFRVAAPAGAGGGDTMTFSAGAAEIELPYTQERTTIDGIEYVRVRFTAMVTPVKAGPIALPPARAVAQLEVGQGRDRFGFPAARLGLFKAADQPRTLDVAALPLAGRPPSFSNAVGTSFSIAVRADRTVVRVGDPIRLDITVKGDARLDGLMLPRLDAPGGIDASKFRVPADPPVGRLTDDSATTKEFQVTVQVQSPEARTIPPIKFSYFDPGAGAYRTVASSEIALQVAGAAVVGAGDVVSSHAAGGAHGGAPVDMGTAAALSLSAPGRTLAGVTSVARIRPILVALYLVPLLLLAGMLWWRRGDSRRQAHGALDAALAEVDLALEHAAARPARDTIGPLTTSLRNLPFAPSGAGREAAGAVEGPVRRDLTDLIARLETAAFAPGAAEKPLPEALRAEVRAAARAWVDAARTRTARSPRTTSAALIFLAALPAPAPTASADPLDEARAAYQEAMASSDRDLRTARFGRAAALLGEQAAAHPDRPELLADWGNAALGAGDLGTAVLAWRRALRLDPGHERARANLDWSRKQQPSWLPRPPGRGAVDTLFFWHERTTRAQRHLAAAVAFAFAVILWLPWRVRRRRLLRRLSILPAAVWLTLIISLLVERDTSHDAVVVTDQVVLRSADGSGAPAALPNPIPAGAEVTVREQRDAWTRVALADGTTGWLPASAVTRISP